MTKKLAGVAVAVAVCLSGVAMAQPKTGAQPGDVALAKFVVTIDS